MSRLTAEDWQYLYGKLSSDKIPEDLYGKVMECPDMITENDETRLKKIVDMG